MEMGAEFESFGGAGIVRNLQNSMHFLATLGWPLGDRHRSVECAAELAARGKFNVGSVCGR